MVVFLTAIVLGLIPISSETSINNGKISLIRNPTGIERSISRSSYNYEYEELELLEDNGQV